MKTLSFPGKKVKDVGGLYYDLLENHFEVENVASGAECTYVHLDDAEDKDPAPLVDTWVERPSAPDSKGALAERKKMALRVTASAQEERAAKAAARAAARQQEEQQREQQTSPEDLGIESLFLTGPADGGAGGQVDVAPRKEGFFSKIFKVFRS